MSKLALQVDKVKTAFSSKDAMISALEVPGPKGHIRGAYSNDDLDPTPDNHRTWSTYNYCGLWFGSIFNANGWSSGSALIAIGIPFGHAMGIAIVGSAIAGAAMALSAYPGSTYGLGYPASARSYFGLRGAFFFVAIRAICAIVWQGVLAYYSGNLFAVALRCIFGSSWDNMAPFPSSAGITSQNFTAFMVLYFAILPLYFIHPRRLRHVFTVKAYLLTPTSIAFAAWALSRSGGFQGFAGNNLTKTELAWGWLKGINVVMGGVSTLIVNQPDLTRYAKHRQAGGWPQGVALFVCKVLLYFFSMSTASALQVAYGGPAQWSLWLQLDTVLDNNWNAGARTGVFFVAIAYAGATILTSLANNSIPFGADVTGLFPRWLTIVRGQLIIFVLGLGLVPWKFLSSASEFITFLGSYTVLCGAIFGIMCADYYVLRRQNLHAPSLYTSGEGDIYWYFKGFNLKACFAWVCAVAIVFPGLAGSYTPGVVNLASQRMHSTGWILSTAIAFTVHLTLSLIWKEPIYPAEYADKPTTTRYLAKDGRRGMFDDETSDLPAMGNLLKTKTGHYSPEEGFEKKEDVEVDVRAVAPSLGRSH